MKIKKLNHLIKIFICSISGFFLFPCNALCQNISDTSVFKNLYNSETKKHEYSEYLNQSDGEIMIVTSMAFLFYKNFISSQDVDACIFNPTCSVYFIEAVEKKGFIRGLLIGTDRLLRCHNYGNQHEYHKNTVNFKYNDPL